MQVVISWSNHLTNGYRSAALFLPTYSTPLSKSKTSVVVVHGEALRRFPSHREQNFEKPILVSYIQPPNDLPGISYTCEQPLPIILLSFPPIQSPFCIQIPNFTKRTPASISLPSLQCIRAFSFHSDRQKCPLACRTTNQHPFA